MMSAATRAAQLMTGKTSGKRFSLAIKDKRAAIYENVNDQILHSCLN